MILISKEIIPEQWGGENIFFFHYLMSWICLAFMSLKFSGKVLFRLLTGKLGMLEKRKTGFPAVTYGKSRIQVLRKDPL